MVTIDTTPYQGQRVEVWSQAYPWGGPITLASTDRGLAFLGFGCCTERLEQLFGTWEQVEQTIELQKVERLHSWGTDFQIAVWRALAEIPKGTVVTYGQIAQQIGRPKAVRAVGSAVGANRISILLPCHRVVGAEGLGGYAWGAPLKQQLLASEGVYLKR